MTNNNKPSSSHSNCTHEATKAARAKCRNARRTEAAAIAYVDRALADIGPAEARAAHAQGMTSRTFDVIDGHVQPTGHDCSQYMLDDNDHCLGCSKLPEGFDF